MQDSSDRDSNQSVTAFSPKRRDVLAGTLGLGLTGAIGSSQATSSTTPTELSSVDSELADGVDRFTHDTTVTIDEDAHDWNVAPWDQQKALTYNGYQYVSYWDDDLSLVLARRNLETGTIQKLTFPHELTRPNDPHNNTALHMSAGDGRLHLSYDMHAQPLNYRRSEAGFLDDPPEELSTDQFSESAGLIDVVERRVTYPRFFTDASDKLYFAYRVGGSGNGEWYLHSYDAEAGTWTRHGMLVDSQGTYEPWSNSSTRNAYFHDIGFDDNNRLHITWTFRETAATYASNHDIHYAYSDDGGVTWKNNDGQQIADLEADDPIRIDDPGIVVVEVPPYSWLINQGAQAIDAQNQPHIFTRVATEPVEDKSQMNDHYVHYWRTPDGEWHDQFITGPEANATHGLRRSDLLFDDDNNLHIYANIGGSMFVAYATPASGWQDWTFYHVTNDATGNLGKHDDRRWEQDNVLSIPGAKGGGFVLEEFSPGAPTGGDTALGTPSLSLNIGGSCPFIGPRIPLNWGFVQGAESFSVSRRSGAGADTSVGWDWSTDGDMLGWQVRADDLSAEVSDSILRLTVDGGDPYMWSPSFSVDAEEKTHIHVRMKNGLSDTSSVLFWKSSGGSWGSPQRVEFEVSANDSEFKDYYIDLSDHDHWTGTINQIRMDPLDPAEDNGVVEVDKIAITAGKPDSTDGEGSSGDDGWETIATGLDGGSLFNSYADTDIEYGTTYEYRVSAVSGGETTTSSSVSAAPTAPAEPVWHWPTDGEIGGWTAGPEGVETSVEDHALRLSVDQVKPEITSPCLEVDAAERDHFLVEMRSEISAGRARIFWRGPTQEWRSSRSQFIDISDNDGEYKRYVVDLSELSGWSGTISTIRLVPIDNGFGTGEIAIDRIALDSAQAFGIEEGTATPTETATDTPTETTGATPTETASATATETTGATPTETTATDPSSETPESTTVPGFGVGAAVVGIVGGTLAAIARRGGGEEEED